jgi:transcriptional regulator with XRE-family HTH domain
VCGLGDALGADVVRAELLPGAGQALDGLVAASHPPRVTRFVGTLETVERLGRHGDTGMFEWELQRGTLRGYPAGRAAARDLVFRPGPRAGAVAVHTAPPVSWVRDSSQASTSDARYRTCPPTLMKGGPWRSCRQFASVPTGTVTRSENSRGVKSVLDGAVTRTAGSNCCFTRYSVPLSGVHMNPAWHQPMLIKTHEITELHVAQVATSVSRMESAVGTETVSDTVELAAVMRHNVHRLRELRGLTVRKLALRLKALGSPIGGSAVSKIEAGARAISIDDWSAIAIALNVPMNALVAVPRTTDREAWAPGDMERAWASEPVRWVEVGQDIRIARDSVTQWFAGEVPSLDLIAPAAKAWVSGEFESFMAAAPFEDRVDHAIFRHPAMMRSKLISSQVKDVLSADAFPDQGDRVSGVTRKGMADFLRSTMEELATNVRILADEIESGARRGPYATFGEDDGANGRH